MFFPTKPWRVVAASFRATRWKGLTGWGTSQRRILAPLDAVTIEAVLPIRLTSTSPASRALVLVASPRNSRISTSSPYFLKMPRSRATYCVSASKAGGLSEDPIFTFTWAQAGVPAKAKANTRNRRAAPRGKREG